MSPRFYAYALTRLYEEVWYHVTGSYHPQDDASIWVNGVPKVLNVMENKQPEVVSDVDWGASIGPTLGSS